MMWFYYNKITKDNQHLMKKFRINILETIV